MKIAQIIQMSLLMLATAATSHGVVVEFTNKAAWQAAAEDHTTIDFTGFPTGTLITSQYTTQGAIFSDNSDYSYLSTSFVNDGAGLYGAITQIAVAFETPMASIGVDYPGALQLDLYNDGLQIYSTYNFPIGGAGHFGGLISTEVFDAAIISRPTGTGVYIDDLHFGPPIPAPGAIALLAAAALCTRRRRRCS